MNKEHFKNGHNIQEKMIGDASVRDTSTLHLVEVLQMIVELLQVAVELLQVIV